MHGSGTESGLVVRCAPFAHIARGDLERIAEGPRTTLAVRVPVDPGQRERLWPVPVRRVDRGDGAGVVEESIGVANGGRDPEFEADVGLRRAGVRDVDRV